MEAGLLLIINDLLERLGDFIFLFVYLMELLSLNQLNTSFIALWCIWKRRNDKQWEEVEIRSVIALNVTRREKNQHRPNQIEDATKLGEELKM